MNKFNLLDLSLLNRPLYKDIYYIKDTSIKIASCNNKNIKVSAPIKVSIPKDLYKDFQAIKHCNRLIPKFRDFRVFQRAVK